MIDVETLKFLLDIQNREKFLNQILIHLKEINQIDFIKYEEYETYEGRIPIIIISKSQEIEENKHVKIFIGAQHNEYNGLFGIIEFLNMIKNSEIAVDNILLNQQVLIFAPLMNPYGFLNPRIDNKSGYYLKNGKNLNRYWRKTFIPDFENNGNDLINRQLPEHTRIIKKLLEKYWVNQDIPIYILDFHETSLLERFTIDLVENLKKDSITYKFSHWLKEAIINNIIKLYNIPYLRKPLFFKCNPDSNHTHINLTIKQLEIVYEKLQDYLSRNKKKLPFYFCYSNKSKDFCKCLAKNVYKKLKDVLWETCFPAFNHSHIDHGCFVNMNDVTVRPKVYSMELESQKQFFNIFDEIEKSKTESDYFNSKLEIMNHSIKLVIESINEMIFQF